MRIAVIIRVYNRIEDLLYNLDIINNTWKSFDYDVFIVSNGSSMGFKVPEINYPNCYLIEILDNQGHINGNSKLLLKGLESIDFNKYEYTIILEADTWLYQDKIIDKYVKLLDKGDFVWASAKWFNRPSLATDFAIIKASFLRNHKKIFDFAKDIPECYVMEYLQEHNKDSIYIKENMPVHIPILCPKNLPFSYNKRFRLFPKSKMVTHHIEECKGGMDEKLRYFNILVGKDYFSSVKKGNYCLERFKIWIVFFIVRITPKKSWFSLGKKDE